MFLAALPAIGAALWVQIPEAAPPQDLEFIRALERAQRLRPRRLTSHARIAPAAEPGTPLTIAGQVFDRDGRSPAPGMTVFAYHTDAQGLYDIRSNGPHSWRLKGWALTGADGRFRFDTIRPAPYPGRNVAAHIHVNLDGPGLKRQSTGILFDDDPLVSREERAESDRAGEFGSVLKVIVRGKGQHVDCRIKIADVGIF
jgi:protocatechuate 3,4-dioxygenase beta subunit